MNKNKTVLSRFAVISLVLLVVLFFGVASAEARRNKDKPVVSSIPEDKRLWPGTPWLIGSLAGAAVIAVGFKNARRSHLD